MSFSCTTLRTGSFVAVFTFIALFILVSMFAVFWSVTRSLTSFRESQIPINNFVTCHIQKYADDTAVIGCITDKEKEEYRSLVRQRQSRLVLFGGEEVEIVQIYKYLYLLLNWTINTKQLYEKTRKYYLRRHL